MTYEQILADYRRLYEEAHDMYDNHIKSCETCKSTEKCVEEMTLIRIIEHFDEIHYKYDCTEDIN